MARVKRPAGTKRVVTKLRISEKKVLTTVINQPSFKREVEMLPHRVIVTKDGSYPARMIRQWEHSEMFRNARQQCVYDTLMCYIEKLNLRIEASSSIDAFNMVKEAAVVLAGSGFLNSLFAKWLTSCYESFEKHLGERLILNRP